MVAGDERAERVLADNLVVVVRTHDERHERRFAVLRGHHDGWANEHVTNRSSLRVTLDGSRGGSVGKGLDLGEILLARNAVHNEKPWHGGYRGKLRVPLRGLR